MTHVWIAFARTMMKQKKKLQNFNLDSVPKWGWIRTAPPKLTLISDPFILRKRKENLNKFTPICIKICENLSLINFSSHRVKWDEEKKIVFLSFSFSSFALLKICIPRSSLLVGKKFFGRFKYFHTPPAPKVYLKRFFIILDNIYTQAKQIEAIRASIVILIESAQKIPSFRAL